LYYSDAEFDPEVVRISVLVRSMLSYAELHRNDIMVGVLISSVQAINRNSKSSELRTAIMVSSGKH